MKNVFLDYHIFTEYNLTIGYDGGHCSHAAAVPGSRCSDQWVWLLRLPERGGGLHRGRAGPRPRLPGSAAARNNTAVACNPPFSHPRSVPPSWGAQRGGAAGRLLPVRHGQGPHYRHLLSTLQVDRGRLSRELQRCHHEQVIRKILQYLS